MIKFLPISKTSIDMFSPVLDLTSSYVNNTGMVNNVRNTCIDKMINSGKHGVKRSVSETKKKFIASQQNWKCGRCDNQLNAWFEVDHKIRLNDGGGNEVDNLIALCRDCHGYKTTMENM
jgi:5-methylcytosine-specific restriction endonuclease McrA